MKVDEFLEQNGIIKNIDPDLQDFLEHFGIRGQRWGVRNKDDKKPKEKVSKQEQDKRNLKAQKYITKANEYQKQIDVLNKQTPKNWMSRNTIKNQVEEFKYQKKVALDAAEAKRQGKFTEKEKFIAKGVTAAAAALAIYGTYTAIQSGQANSLLMRGKAFLSRKGITTWKKNSSLSNPNLDSDEIMSSVVKHINPEYGELGTKMNCRRATFAYEMRRRGYDVSATRTTTGAGGEVGGLYNVLNPGTDFVGPGRLGEIRRTAKESIKKTLGLAKDKPYSKMIKESGLIIGKVKIEGGGIDAPTSIFKTLAQQPNASRGELGVNWSMGGGHSLAYEVIKNKPVIFDAQNGRKYINDTEFLHDVGGNILEAGFTRLDNIDLNQGYLLRWLKNAKH